MIENLQYHTIDNYCTISGKIYPKIPASFEIFGKPLHSAPIVLINHALTGNSDVASPEKGWWNTLIGDHKLIDTQKYTVIAINIIGNGYDGFLVDDYKDFSTKDIAQIFYAVLKSLNIEQLYAIVGGSLGGGIAWEMASLYPNFTNYIIPIAADLKSTDWIIGFNSVQENILQNSKEPLQDARKMAMLFYRTPSSFSKKFNRTKTSNNEKYNVASWLDHHGEKLNNRFDLKAYLMMNHLLSTIDISNENNTAEEMLAKITANVIQIAVSSDIFFVKEENINTKKLLDALNKPNEYHEIISEDGHDAFLIETEQISNFLKPIFN